MTSPSLPSVRHTRFTLHFRSHFKLPRMATFALMSGVEWVPTFALAREAQARVVIDHADVWETSYNIKTMIVYISSVFNVKL